MLLRDYVLFLGCGSLYKEYKYLNGFVVEPRNINDVIIVRKYGEELIKIHSINSYPNPKILAYDKRLDCHRESIMIDGFEFYRDEIMLMPNGEVKLLPKKNYSDKNTVNDVKLLNNLTRAKNKILEYALCNPWEFFVTLTINKDKHNRYDLQSFYKKFTQFIRDNYNKKGHKVSYLFVPEKHKNGAWHLHGFIMGLPENALCAFNLKQKLPKYIRDKLINGDVIYDWSAYHDKFGFCDIEPIKSHEKASYYVTKYITKDLQHNVTKLGGKLYYNSLHLKCAEVVAKGNYNGNLVFDYENEFCKCNTLAYSDELMNYIISKVSDKDKYLEPNLFYTDDYLKKVNNYGLYLPESRKKLIDEIKKKKECIENETD